MCIRHGGVIKDDIVFRKDSNKHSDRNLNIAFHFDDFVGHCITRERKKHQKNEEVNSFGFIIKYHNILHVYNPESSSNSF